MKGNYKQVPVFSATTRFDQAPQSGVERSRMTESTTVLTAFNGGEIVPIKCFEVLPQEVYSVRFEDIIRQTTLKTPTMGEMICDMYAFFVPNRVVNRSWVNVQGENSSGVFTAPSVTLAPLYTGTESVQIAVGSVADYYGLPTQKPIPADVLRLMNDLVFRGYLEIYNQYFRDQNYQPPIPYSRENVHEGFLLPVGSDASLGLVPGAVDIPSSGPAVSSGSFPNGALLKSVYGDGSSAASMNGTMSIPSRRTTFSALDKPLRANKFHDALTSVLPSPQKGPAVTFSLADSAPLEFPSSIRVLTDSPHFGSNVPLSGSLVGASGSESADRILFSRGNATASNTVYAGESGSAQAVANGFVPDNLWVNRDDMRSAYVDLTQASAISVDDLRLGFAMQQLYELYGRSGTRYRELCHAMFGVDVDDPFSDIPRLLGHVRFPLELYQTAQTSSSSDISPQGNLAAFGYTNRGGFLFHETFLEHGYVHILCTVRQRNVYSSYVDPHWFRLNQLDFYTPILANISEQPILLRTVNPFSSDNPNSTVFGYQEAWWEYRQHPDIVTGIMRSGVPANLSSWTYQDVFSDSQSSADADFMESNAADVLDLTLAVTSAQVPQFRALFKFHFDHEFPGPVYSVPGLDVV